MTANIRHSSENSEFMTPQWLTDWAHHVMGCIDLDPATSEVANRTVRASRIFTKADNGLFMNWWNLDGSPSRLYLNPPGGLTDEAGNAVIRKSKTRSGCTESGACGLLPGHKHSGVVSSACFWWHKLIYEFHLGHVQSAVFLGFSLELLQSAQSFTNQRGGLNRDCHQKTADHPLDFPCCVPKQRIRFETEVDSARSPGEQPTHANVIVLVCREPDNTTFEEPNERRATVQRFKDTFSQIGYVHVPRGF